MGEEKRNVARKEADKLIKVGFIKKAHYTTWLANVVMVKNLMVSGGCIRIIPTSTKFVQKILILYQASTI